MTSAENVTAENKDNISKETNAIIVHMITAFIQASISFPL